MNQLWQYWKFGINDETIDLIEKHSNNCDVSPATIGYDGALANANLRTSEIKWFDPQNSDLKPIVDLLWYYAEEANKNAFGFCIDYLREIQHTTYRAENSGHYDWHYDTFWANPTTYDRKISIVIQLSESEDYVGGNLQFDAQYPQPNAEEIRQKGTVIVFPSFLVHRVTPVLSGVRKSLVTWIQGPKFK